MMSKLLDLAKTYVKLRLPHQNDAIDPARYCNQDTALEPDWFSNGRRCAWIASHPKTGNSGLEAAPHSISKSSVSRHLGADLASARQGETTTTWMTWKWNWKKNYGPQCTKPRYRSQFAKRPSIHWSSGYFLKQTMAKSSLTVTESGCGQVWLAAQ